ncbi:MAG TPA: glycosyltransferase [Candidatus Brocadiaceae bacterium]|nr:glycosyltransferase [Candidatus Brocadiaceae bacterium]
MHTISILISTKNRFQDLKECVVSLLALSIKPDEVILVDAGDTNKSREMVEKLLMDTGISLTYHRQNVIDGKIKKTMAWNRAVKTALGDIIVFLDDDVVLEKDYLSQLLKAYRENTIPGVVGVTGYTKNPHNEKQKSPMLSSLKKSLYKCFLLYRDDGGGRIQPSGFPAYSSAKNAIIPVAVMPTCNMSVKKEVFGEFVFDEWFHGYSYQEDDDFTYRVSRNHKFLYTPFAELTHKTSPAARDNAEKVEAMKALNHFYFFRKNMPKTPKNCLAFLWAEIGILFFRCVSFASLRDFLLSFTGVMAWRNIPVVKARILTYASILTQMRRKRKSKNS